MNRNTWLWRRTPQATTCPTLMHTTCSTTCTHTLIADLITHDPHDPDLPLRTNRTAAVNACMHDDLISFDAASSAMTIHGKTWPASDARTSTTANYVHDPYNAWFIANTLPLNHDLAIAEVVAAPVVVVVTAANST